jgi:hypothetical protein
MIVFLGKDDRVPRGAIGKVLSKGGFSIADSWVKTPGYLQVEFDLTGMHLPFVKESDFGNPVKIITMVSESFCIDLKPVTRDIGYEEGDCFRISGYGSQITKPVYPNYVGKTGEIKRVDPKNGYVRVEWDEDESIQNIPIDSFIFSMDWQ